MCSQFLKCQPDSIKDAKLDLFMVKLLKKWSERTKYAL